MVLKHFYPNLRYNKSLDITQDVRYGSHLGYTVVTRIAVSRTKRLITLKKVTGPVLSIIKFIYLTLIYQVIHEKHIKKKKKRIGVKLKQLTVCDIFSEQLLQ